MEFLSKVQFFFQNFICMDNIIIKFMCKGKGTIIPKTILKKNSVGRISLTDYKAYYTAMVIRIT